MDNKSVKLKLISQDPEMMKAVFDSLEDIFREYKEHEDVHMKASRFIALQLLDEGRRYIDSFKPTKNQNDGKKTIHL